MRPPDLADTRQEWEPTHDIEAALILLIQCRLRVPPELSVVRAALNVAETALLGAQEAEREREAGDEPEG